MVWILVKLLRCKSFEMKICIAVSALNQRYQRLFYGDGTKVQAGTGIDATTPWAREDFGKLNALRTPPSI